MPNCYLTATALAELDQLAMDLLWAGRDRDADAIYAVMEADGLASPEPKAEWDRVFGA